jgi:hypothetical protein
VEEGDSVEQKRKLMKLKELESLLQASNSTCIYLQAGGHGFVFPSDKAGQAVLEYLLWNIWNITCCGNSTEKSESLLNPVFLHCPLLQRDRSVLCAFCCQMFGVIFMQN